MLTDFHSKYFAAELTKRCPSDSAEKLAGAFVDAQVDLNPHQVEAALFAFRTPLSMGALLADEVGLGKTIEAGLVLSQKWAERKRKILAITPSNLRKQWHQELQEKFFIPCDILESRSYNLQVKNGIADPFAEGESIKICSYHFARNKADDVRRVPWDLVVIDEAHRLRNVYKPSNVIANTLRSALAGVPKLLLTATPLQNSLLELYGLVSFLDEHLFGDLKSFREQYAYLNDQRIFNALKSRLKPVCQRTLRKNVANVSFTKRHPILEQFTPKESEERLYSLVSTYLQRTVLHALPTSQRTLITLVLRKLLASSTFAIAGALESLSKRLQARLKKQKLYEDLQEQLGADFEGLAETAEEWPEELIDVEPLTEEEKAAIQKELSDLQEFRDLAISVEQNAKGVALIAALDRAFEEMKRLGGAEKAIIFTESRRTQDYLVQLLADSKYGDGIVLFNGSNSDERSKSIYAAWLKKHAGSDKITGSKTADMRSALVDEFRENARLMIATEAGAEGINLQFCSLVVNYDLPWNPQRIEQRIGRCHRYGQKHDVVVVNFLNRKNEADQRVFELLSEKFALFEGVFGASDEVLGTLESGVDFEKRIADIYQRCRTSDEIQAAFDQLKVELSAQLNESMAKTRQELLENFDEEVHEKVRAGWQGGDNYLNRYEQLLVRLAQHELRDHAEFLSADSFRLERSPFFEANGKIPLGLYELPRRTGDAHLFRLGHPLAQKLLKLADERTLEPAKVTFDYSGHLPRITPLEPFVGNEGEMLVYRFTVNSFEQSEDYLFVAARTAEGTLIEPEIAARFFSLDAIDAEPCAGLSNRAVLEADIERQRNATQRAISERNARFFEAEAEKLDNWADDLKVSLEREIKEIDRQIKEARRAATIAVTLEEKLAGQKQVKALEAQRNKKRRSLFDSQDEIDERRGKLIEEIEGKLEQKAEMTELFSLKWVLV
jgi:adenine-specific DNA-methyltransferase